MRHPEEDAPLLRLLVLESRQMAEDLQVRLAAQGFSDQRFAHNHVFGHIRPEGSRLTELAERAGMTKQAMAEIVSDLEALGYLHRTPDPADRRAKLIELTDRGWAAVDAAMRSFAEMDAELDDRIGTGRMRQLRRTLLQMLDVPS